MLLPASPTGEALLVMGCWVHPSPALRWPPPGGLLELQEHSAGGTQSIQPQGLVLLLLALLILVFRSPFLKKIYLEFIYMVWRYLGKVTELCPRQWLGRFLWQYDT